MYFAWSACINFQLIKKMFVYFIFVCAGLHCYIQAFSSWQRAGPILGAVYWLLIAVASLAAGTGFRRADSVVVALEQRSQPFWHQGQVSWKTTFPRCLEVGLTGGG